MFYFISWSLSMSFLVFLPYMYEIFWKIFSLNMVFENINVLLILLSMWLVLMSILAMPESMFLRSGYLFMCFISLGIVLLGAFVSSKFLFFFLFFEVSLIPTFFLMMGWGVQPERLQAGFYLFSYTMLGSLPLLVSIVYLYKKYFCLSMILWSHFFFEMGKWVCMFFLLAFFMKLPVFGVHIWLTKAHVEAPVAGSMILAGILLKLGGFGMFRLLEIFSLISLGSLVTVFVLWLVVSVVVVCMMCLRKMDLKSLVAYSSVAHMAICLAGVVSLNVVSMYGFSLLMIAHGLCSSGLFFLIKIVYEISGSRKLLCNRGFLVVSPLFMVFWVSLVLINSSLPPSLNFFSEFILIFSILKFSSLNLGFLVVMVFLNGLFKVLLCVYLFHKKWDVSNNFWKKVNFRQYLSLWFHLLPIFCLVSCGMIFV